MSGEQSEFEPALVYAAGRMVQKQNVMVKERLGCGIRVWVVIPHMALMDHPIDRSDSTVIKTETLNWFHSKK